ncbi:MAG: ABC transporter permease [Gemmatimonadetes bacterium]|nr:ABC transporter permease [Gemmatimonadota bacterium]
MEFGGLLEATIRITVPILLATLGEMIAERSGVLNIGLEGMMLTGAFAAFVGSWLTGDPGIGLALAVVTAMALAAVFSLFVVRWALDPIVTGVAINVLALGATGVLFRALTADTGTVLVASFPEWPLGNLARIPGIGPALFSQNGVGYAAFALAPLVMVALRFTSPGLLVRAAGENPDAVEAAGGRTALVRLLATLVGGAFAGAAGAYLSIGYSDTFVENMTAGRGFVALAIVVFARWSPLLAVPAALTFGLAMALQVRLQGQAGPGGGVPYQFFQMLPYVLTLVVLALVPRGAAGAPAALARPWRRSR